MRLAHLHVNILFLHTVAIVWNRLCKFLRRTNSNLFSYDRNHSFAVEVNLQRSVTYNVPSPPTFLACIPLPGRINITVNVYMRTALRATVSLTLPLCFSSFFLFSYELQRVSVAVSHFFISHGEPSRLTFLRVAHATTAVVYNSQSWSRTRDFYIHMCEINVGCRCGRHFIKTTGWRFSFCPAAAPTVVFSSSVN